MSLPRRILAVVLACAAALAVAGLSRLPASPLESSQPILRLSWRTLGVRLEECRARSEEELAALAPHMRTPRVCTGFGADYELSVRLDGAEAARDTVRPAGARHDRPIYVFRDLAVEPGRHRVEVRFAALVPPGYEAGNAPLEYEWEGDLLLEAAEIALVTLDPSGKELMLRER